MTSYQELTAEGESSPLFTGCCRAKEVINRDPGGRAHPELGGRDEEGTLELEVASGFNTPQPRYSRVSNSLTLSNSLDCPPPPPPPPPCNTEERLSTPACPHSHRVPWWRRAQGQPAPGRGCCCASGDEQTLHSDFGSLPDQIHLDFHSGPDIHVAVGTSAGVDRDVDVNRKTFEWMRVKRTQQRAGKFFVCGWGGKG